MVDSQCVDGPKVPARMEQQYGAAPTSHVASTCRREQVRLHQLVELPCGANLWSYPVELPYGAMQTRGEGAHEGAHEGAQMSAWQGIMMHAATSIAACALCLDHRHNGPHR